MLVVAVELYVVPLTKRKLFRWIRDLRYIRKGVKGRGS
jgi:hypothetical protein